MQCDLKSGTCHCLPGVIGEKCEKCPERWVLIPETRCQPCSECVHGLLNDIDELEPMSSTMMANIDSSNSYRLHEGRLNYTKSRLANFTRLFNLTFELTPELIENQTITKLLEGNQTLLSTHIDQMEGKVVSAYCDCD